MLIPKWLVVFFFSGLLVVFSGCTHLDTMKNGIAKEDNCLVCHVANNALGARDLSKVDFNNSSHHKVNFRYPLDAKASSGYKTPDAQYKNGLFFDSNQNGQLEIDEVRMVKVSGNAMVTCGSCHREHEPSSAATKQSNESYLRSTMEASTLCTACHRI